SFLDALDRPADDRCLTLLAVEGPTVLGVGQVVVAGPASREGDVALLVRDTHHRQGIGLVLARALVRHAVDVGLSVLRAQVLTENRAVRDLLARHFAAADGEPDGPETSYELRLRR